MIPYMMLGATPISPSPAHCLSNACSPAAPGEQARFEQSLGQVASNQDVASSVADRTAVVPTVSEVQRASTLASPSGDRVLQALSSMYHSHAVAPAAGSARSVPNGMQPGPAAQPLLQPVDIGAHAAVKPVDADFDAMVVNLRDVYSGAVQVSLVSKSTGAVSSSLNKLLSAG
ncbi:nodulation protein NolB [Bradyrhizobium brasilense]|uniref:nodulation protein NolB n=1 Tax=Bradyrhizobium brasilense TaxID=1419277 RepID=UPI002877AFC2|nr:nodulation protein NolB [Bradyrhizobium brasilense]MCP3413527.1 nodulation protein NolB [Bradyrhizobium brasilense]